MRMESSKKILCSEFDYDIRGFAEVVMKTRHLLHKCILMASL